MNVHILAVLAYCRFVCMFFGLILNHFKPSCGPLGSVLGSSYLVENHCSNVS